MKWRLEEGDSFLREIVTKGKVLYEKADGGLGKKAEADYLRAVNLSRILRNDHDGTCFHCQQAAEKYLKTLLEEWALVCLGPISCAIWQDCCFPTTPACVNFNAVSNS